MAPKKQANVFSSEYLATIDPLSEFFASAKESFDWPVGDLFNEVITSIDALFTSRTDEAAAINLDWHDICRKIVTDDMRERVRGLGAIKKKNKSSENPRAPAQLKPKPTSSRRIIKEEITEETEVVTTTPVPTAEEATYPSSSRPCTPPVTAVTTDEEMEALTIPRTALRMQKMIISESRENHLSPHKSAFGSPRKPVIPPTYGTPSRTKHLAAFVVSSSTNVLHSEVENDKIQHASVLKKKFLDQKVLKAKQQEEKRKLVKERHETIQREQREKLEEKKRKEEKALEFQKAANLLRSPPRTRKADNSAKTPVPKCTKSVFGNDAPTPGRRPAKFGRVEQLVEGETVAQPTVNLSPSREPQRSAKRVKPVVESQDFKVFDKPVLKAKRNQSPSKDKQKLLAAQEAYLLEQSSKRNEEERLAAAEEEKENLRKLKKKEEAERKREEAERKKEEAERKKKLEEEKRIEEERKKREENEKWLKKVQEEEAERLRIETEQERKAYEAAMAKQASKQVLDEKKGKPPVACYEMTPPRVYKAPTKDDYGLDDLNSDDETDQEDDPRKDVPSWADWAVVRRNVRNHHNNPPFDVDAFFGTIKKTDLKLIFGSSVHVKKRGSSAVWRSPAAGVKPQNSIFGGTRK